jgi:hypothetical protein
MSGFKTNLQTATKAVNLAAVFEVLIPVYLVAASKAVEPPISYQSPKVRVDPYSVQSNGRIGR